MQVKSSGIAPAECSRCRQACPSVPVALGALLPLLGGLGAGATVASVVIGAVAALGVGTALALFTDRTWWRSAFRQLAISTVAAAVTFGSARRRGLGAPLIREGHPRRDPRRKSEKGSAVNAVDRTHRASPITDLRLLQEVASRRRARSASAEVAGPGPRGSQVSSPTKTSNGGLCARSRTPGRWRW